ncbi:hypothetical protein [Magnetospira sp. QH-2]|uniref:hypothetical protein n=1 Tax=Magnetospira sp. (strain QH-2) TaxID=1288970 RepID=UPI0003E8193E|nr:hypothetical protein [Magnetospira sp. QH-2]CCQ75779.1 protein of unknown function [Magnetospira sp. QH-2]
MSDPSRNPVRRHPLEQGGEVIFAKVAAAPLIAMGINKSAVLLTPFEARALAFALEAFADDQEELER